MTTDTLPDSGTRTITYGVIGCGMMGQEHLRNIALLDNTAVGAIFEPDAKMRAQASQLAPDAQFVDSIEALLDIPEVDCLLIASPNFRHVEQLQEIAVQNPLPVLIEKPLFTDPAHVAAIDAFAASYPAPVWVAMEYRYMPPVAKFLEEVEAVTGGIKMLTIREHRFPFLDKVGAWNRFNRYTGGTFVEKCCHFFDLMRLALRSDPVRIMAMGDRRPIIWTRAMMVRGPMCLTMATSWSNSRAACAPCSSCACSPKARGTKRKYWRSVQRARSRHWFPDRGGSGLRA